MDKTIIVNIARQTLQDAFNCKQTIDTLKLKEDYPFLKEDGASFVTLTQKGKLRGCIGSLVAHSPLLEDIMSNAYNAAFKDPRFPKLTQEELPLTDIEVSILSVPQKIEYEDFLDLQTKITPMKDGIILQLGSNQATFLPQVWEELPEFESFFTHLFAKANLSLESFKYHPTIYKYQVEKFR